MEHFIETHIATVSCIFMGLIMFFAALPFAFGKEKMARYVSGFNMFTPEEQKNYDCARISRDIRNLYFQLAILEFAGAALTLISQWLAIPVFLLWIIWFFKDVHLDRDKAFQKYRLK